MWPEGNAEQTGHRALGWSQSGRIRDFVPPPIRAQPGSVVTFPFSCVLSLWVHRSLSKAQGTAVQNTRPPLGSVGHIPNDRVPKKSQ